MSSTSPTQGPTVPESWSGIIVACHWATVLLVVALCLIGYVVNGPAITDIHANLGALLFFVFLLRLGARFVTRAPAASRRRSALAAHLLLYSALAAMLVTGPSAVARSAFIPAAQLLGTWDLPRVLPISAAEGAMFHAWIAYGLVALIGAHAMAVVTRRFRGDTTVLHRMLPSKLRSPRAK